MGKEQNSGVTLARDLATHSFCSAPRTRSGSQKAGGANCQPEEGRAGLAEPEVGHLWCQQLVVWGKFSLVGRDKAPWC